VQGSSDWPLPRVAVDPHRLSGPVQVESVMETHVMDMGMQRCKAHWALISCNIEAKG